MKTIIKLVTHTLTFHLFHKPMCYAIKFSLFPQLSSLYTCIEYLYTNNIMSHNLKILSFTFSPSIWPLPLDNHHHITDIIIIIMVSVKNFNLFPTSKLCVWHTDDGGSYSQLLKTIKAMESASSKGGKVGNRKQQQNTHNNGIQLKLTVSHHP